MIPFLPQIVNALSRVRGSWFLLIWSALTVGAAICVACVLNNATTPTVQQASTAPIDLTRKREYVAAPNSVAILTLLALFLVGYVVVILIWEDFTYYDNSMFTLHTLMGRNLRPPIWPSNGRFFPLGHLEFDLIRHFTGRALGYHVLTVVQLLIFSCILLILDDELSITNRACLMALVLVVPSVVVSFGALIFTERNVMLWLASLVFFMRRFEQTKSTVWGVAAVVSAQTMIYYKEIAFVLLLGLAIGGLVFRQWKGAQSGKSHKWLREKENRLDLCLVSLTALFLLFYISVMIPHPNMQYADEWRLPPMEVFLAYMKVDLLACLLVAVFFSRSFLMWRRKAKPSPLWDGLALGGIGCFAAYLYLGMFASYYLAPVDLIAVLYMGRFAILSWGHMPLWGRAASWVVLCAVLLQVSFMSAFCVFERKNVIHGKAELARIIEAQYQNNPRNCTRLFFPFASPVLIMQFAAYLNYRGVPIEGANVEPTDLNSVIVLGGAIAKEGPCVAYESLMCHADGNPERGDLVVVLPDDEASLVDVTPYRERGELLFSYEPRPSIPRWLYPFVGYLHAASPHTVHKAIPDRWLDASVTARK